MKSARPMFLNLTKMRFPITAITSIFHRLTGVLLFFCVPFLLYLLDKSLHTNASGSLFSCLFSSAAIEFFFWLSVSLLAYHLLAGVRHMVMDCGFFESFAKAKRTAGLLFILTAFCVILLGVWIW